MVHGFWSVRPVFPILPWAWGYGWSKRLSLDLLYGSDRLWSVSVGEFVSDEGFETFKILVIQFYIIVSGSLQIKN